MISLSLLSSVWSENFSPNPWNIYTRLVFDLGRSCCSLYAYTRTKVLLLAPPLYSYTWYIDSKFAHVQHSYTPETVLKYIVVLNFCPSICSSYPVRPSSCLPIHSSHFSTCYSGSWYYWSSHGGFMRGTRAYAHT